MLATNLGSTVHLQSTVNCGNINLGLKQNFLNGKSEKNKTERPKAQISSDKTMVGAQNKSHI